MLTFFEEFYLLHRGEYGETIHDSFVVNTETKPCFLVIDNGITIEPKELA